MTKKFRIIPMLLVMLCTCISGNYVQAEERSENILAPGSLLVNSHDKTSIEELAPEILDMANSFETDGFHAELSDIAFDDAYTIYVDADIIENQPDDPLELAELLEQADVVWNIPVYSNNETVIVQVSRALELDEIDQSQLTDDEIADAAESASKWQTVASTLYDKNADETNITDALSEYNSGSGQYEAVLVGGEPGIQSVIAVITDGDSVSGAVSLKRDITFDADKQTRSGNSHNEVTLEQSKLYPLSEFAKVAESLQAETKAVPESTRGASLAMEESNTSSAQFFLAAAVIVVIAAAAVLILKKIRKAK